MSACAVTSVGWLCGGKVKKLGKVGTAREGKVKCRLAWESWVVAAGNLVSGGGAVGV